MFRSTRIGNPATWAGVCLLMSSEWPGSMQRNEWILPYLQTINLFPLEKNRMMMKNQVSLSSVSCTHWLISGTSSREARTPSAMCIHRVFNQNLSRPPTLASCQGVVVGGKSSWNIKAAHQSLSFRRRNYWSPFRRQEPLLRNSDHQRQVHS